MRKLTTSQRALAVLVGATLCTFTAPAQSQEAGGSQPSEAASRSQTAEEFVARNGQATQQQIFKIGRVAARQIPGLAQIGLAMMGRNVAKDPPLEVAVVVFSAPGTPPEGKVYTVRLYRPEARIGHQTVTYSRRISASEAVDGTAVPVALRTLFAGMSHLDARQCDKLRETIATIRREAEEKKTEKGETAVFTYDIIPGLQILLGKQGKKTEVAVDVGGARFLTTLDGLEKLGKLVGEATDKVVTLKSRS